MIQRIKQFFCRHEWHLHNFQVLGPFNTDHCTKCGKFRHD
ncbi:hypothetical protein FIU89_11320 [Roseovarius sp. THAF27]|nr:hypothetical protein FIU89_11320 [Roseovarius sp. THAF27]